MHHLGQLLGISHVTVNRARHRLDALAQLDQEWQAVPLTQTTDTARRREQIATFLQADPAVVDGYERTLDQPMTSARLLDRIARRMTDSDETEDAAKAAIRQSMEATVVQHEQERALRRANRPPRPPKLTPEERAAAEADRQATAQRWQQERRAMALLETLQPVADLLEHGWTHYSEPEPVTLGELAQALTPNERQELPALLAQAEAVIQTIRDLLAQPSAAP
jgi:hypothetical protein